MVITVRGRRALAMLIGALGATLQITAISQVVTNLDDPLSIAAYSAAVGLGVALGLVAGDLLTPGTLGLVAGDLLTPGTLGVTITTTSPKLTQALWSHGWPATVHVGHGPDGPVEIVSVAINRRHEAALHEVVQLLDPDARRTATERAGGCSARSPNRALGPHVLPARLMSTMWRPLTCTCT
jgi:uncharacterized protein YebE (UPF0316 family)